MDSKKGEEDHEGKLTSNSAYLYAVGNKIIQLAKRKIRKEHNMKKNEEKIAIYCRKSKFTGKGESVANQEELCKEYIRNFLGEAYVERCVVFEDEGFSGGDMKRPAFQKMMEEVRKHKIKAIVVYRLDRISRNISDFAGLIDELGRLEVSFVSIREQFDTTTPMGRAMMYIISVFSQLERETIAERIRDNMQELAKTGRWLGGNTPTGFTSGAVEKVSIDGRTRKSYKLIPLPDEIEIPKLIFELYKTTDSLTAVETELLRRGIKTKQGKHFSRFAIKGILQNPVYMVADQEAYGYFMEKEAAVCSQKEAFDGTYGVLGYNRTRQEKGKKMELLPTSEWIIAIGQHPGVVSSKQWIKVQESLERNKEKGYRKPRINEALLTGLVYCSCGSRMYPKLTKRKSAEGEALFSYVCKMKERSKGSQCKQRNINGNLLDEMVIHHLKKLAMDQSCFFKQLENCRQHYVGNRSQYEVELAELRKKIAENENISNGLLDVLGTVQDSFARSKMLQRIEEVGAENREIEKRVRELEGLISEHGLDEMDFEMLPRMLVEFNANIDAMTVPEKRDAIRTIVRKIVWDGENAHIFLFGSDDERVELGDTLDFQRITNAANFEESAGKDLFCGDLDDTLEDFDENNTGLLSKSPWRGCSK